MGNALSMIYYHYGILKRQENLQLFLFKNHILNVRTTNAEVERSISLYIYLKATVHILNLRTKPCFYLLPKKPLLVNQRSINYYEINPIKCMYVAVEEAHCILDRRHEFFLRLHNRKVSGIRLHKT